MASEAFRPTDRQVTGIEKCIAAVGGSLDVPLSEKHVNELRRLALPLVFEGWSPKYVVARMMLHCGAPELWEEIQKEFA